jgi:hypothetical protein
MELLLNLLWLMLALPAVLIWRHHLTSARATGRFSGSHSIVLLCCLLALLFPIVSATDDLHPLRIEIEESSPSKRVVKQSPAPASPAWGNAGGLPALLPQSAWRRDANETLGLVAIDLPVSPQPAPASTIGSRAPPSA